MSIKSIILFSQILVSLPIFSQTLTGTWEGVFFSDMSRYERKKFILHMELKQEGNKLKGVFYTAKFEKPNEPEAIYTISGILGKKDPLAFFKLMEDNLVEYTIPYEIANAFNEFACTYTTKDSSEFLYGNWYPNNRNTLRADGAGGSYQLKKFAPVIGELYIKYIDNKKKKKKADNVTETDSTKQHQ
ncbi:MAG: hypothetical protein JSR09_09580 [Bacteroidetes bacterium]|nr:hypothetical protein [Bacteroidota bacterium]MBS1640132.1 hypothetical protein [Bacteroidota bacterium]MBS1649940.1 hypothetical protein [Bacteroidota bacterium]